MPITIKKNVMAYKNQTNGTYVGVDAVNDATLEERIGDVESELEDKYEKPANGIPASDIASGVIPDVSGKTDQGAVATPYGSLTWPVTAGQYCFQNGYVYRAKQNIATSESWTAAHWDQVVLGDEVCRAMTAIQGIGDFVGDTDTDLGTHDEGGMADLTNMTPATATEGNVDLAITKTHITASGTSNDLRIRNLQEIAEATAGDYEFSIGSEITSTGYYLQVYNVTDDVVICALGKSAIGTEYQFTLSGTKKLRIRVMITSGNVINESNEIYLHKGGTIQVPNTLADATKELRDFSSPDTDIGEHEEEEITDYTNMGAKSVTDGNVQLTITKTHIKAYGTCNSTTLRNLQENIVAPAGDYEFDIGTIITSSGYQLQIYNYTDNVVIVSMNNNAGSVAKFTLAGEKNLRIRSYVSTGNAIDESNEIHLRRIKKTTVKNTLAHLAMKHDERSMQGKKILVFGDSIWGDDRTNGIADYLAEYSGATIFNAGIGGTRITGDRTQAEVPKFIPFDGVTLINAYLSKTWTDQDAGASEVWEYVSASTLPMLKALDIQDVDIVILAYGTNDFTAPKTIEAVSSAFLYAVSALLTANPKLRIVCIVPPWRMFSSGTVDGDVYENGNGDTQQEYNTGIETAIKAKHIETLNMLERLPWRAETKKFYMDSDATHPNPNGNQIYAHVVHGKLRSMY